MLYTSFQCLLILFLFILPFFFTSAADDCSGNISSGSSVFKNDETKGILKTLLEFRRDIRSTLLSSKEGNIIYSIN